MRPQPGLLPRDPGQHHHSLVLPGLMQGGGQAAHLDLPPALRQLVRQVAEEVAGIPAEVLESSTLVAVGTSMHAGEAAKSGRLQLLRLRPYCSEVGGQRTTGWKHVQCLSVCCWHLCA